MAESHVIRQRSCRGHVRAFRRALRLFIRPLALLLTFVAMMFRSQRCPLVVWKSCGLGLMGVALLFNTADGVTPYADASGQTISHGEHAPADGHARENGPPPRGRMLTVRPFIPSVAPIATQLARTGQQVYRRGQQAIAKQPFRFHGVSRDFLKMDFKDGIPMALSTWVSSRYSLQHSRGQRSERHVGRGQPLQGTSWLNRPFHADAFLGVISSSTLVSGAVDQKSASFGGYRLGQEFDHYWGWEARLAFSSPSLTGPAGDAIPGSGRNLFIDAHLLYYPWGDARWRPYASLGLGAANFKFQDEDGTEYQESAVHLPLGVGVKYQWHNWLALRFDLLNSFTMGGGSVDFMHNVTFTGGFEVRLGGRRRVYFPWNPGIRYR